MAGPWERFAAPQSEPQAPQQGPWTRCSMGEAQQGPQVIATTRDGGRVMRSAEGSLSFTSPGFSTNDPDRIAQIMEGAQPVELMQGDIDRERIAQNPVAARAQEVLRGVPFVGSYADEAVGMVSPDAAQNMRATSEAMQRQNPGQTAGLNIGGAIAGSIPMALAAAPSLAGRVASTAGGRALQGLGFGAAVGAAEGGIYGAGEGQGDERLSNTATGAGIGAAAGGVVGAAAPYVAQGVGAMLGRLRNSDVATIASQLGISRRAAVVVRDALQSGDMNAAEAALQRAGPDAMLADAGMPARQLLDAAAASGGGAGAVARGAIQQRTQDATAKITTALDNVLGQPAGEREIIDAIRTGSQPQRSAAYDAAYATPIDYSNPRARNIESLLSRVPASAIRRAEEIMRARGEESAQIMARISDDGRVTFDRMPDVRQLHYIMQGLDDIASATDGAGVLGRQTTLGASYERLRGQIGDNLKRLVPEFEAAQNIAADTIQEIRATELGYNMLRAQTRREDVARGLANASEAEKRAARLGVRSYIDDITANVARTVSDPDTQTREGIRMLRDFSSRANQTKLRVLLGERQANNLLRDIDEAATAFELRAAIAENSKTAMRQSIQGGVDAQASQGVLRTLASGEPVNATKRLVQAITGETAEAQELRRLGLYEEIATALTAQRGPQARSALRAINAAIRGEQISTAQARLISNVVQSSAVLTGGRAASQVNR
jgi:hypothetical protein